jgi:uncharacterized membrane protein
MDSLFSGVHLHLLVNHVPIMGAFFALALLIASYLFAPDVLRRTAFVALIVTAFAGLAANKTGDPAEDAIRGFPGVSRDVIHAHEDMADKAYLIGGVVGVLALGGLLKWRRAPVPAGATLVMLLSTAFLSGAMAYTGLLGGRVRHTEVRPGAVPADAMTIEPPRAKGPGG